MTDLTEKLRADLAERDALLLESLEYIRDLLDARVYSFSDSKEQIPDIKNTIAKIEEVLSDESG
jgi:hypothetical protein